MADRFVEAVEAGRYDVADAMFHDSWGQSLAHFMERDERNRQYAERLPQSPLEWLKGECRVNITSIDFHGLGGEVTIVLLATNDGMKHGFVAEPAEPVQYDIGTEVSHEFRR
jgi:hypothetical protein